MNGGCRRLLKTAVPKLNLNLEQMYDDVEHDDDAIDLPMETDPLAENSVDEIYDDTGIRDVFEIKYDPIITAGKSTNQRRDIR